MVYNNINKLPNKLGHVIATVCLLLLILMFQA